jgi:hypothetical protein
VITVGGGSVSTPALTKAIREIGEAARKQFDETGSLAGFSAQATDDSSQGGTVKISVSALGAAAYDASASKDDTVLAFTLQTAQPDGGGGTATSLDSGSSLVIESDQDIDAFVQNFQNTTKQISFGSFLYGTREEIDLASGVDPSTDTEVTGASTAVTANQTAGDGTFAAFQQKQDVASRIVSALQSFLDGLRGADKPSSSLDAKASSATHSTLKDLLARLDLKA